MMLRTLGIEGLQVSAIGLGCMGLSQGYGPADDDESVRVVHRALDLGVTMLDTAMSYGQGHNERLIARALANRAEKVMLATKFGIVRDESGARLDGRPDHVRGYCEASRSRLGTDVIDLYYLHRDHTYDN
jgi:aryl-alcohol dehydrogenase-like predicted oxidoreductase